MWRARVRQCIPGIPEADPLGGRIRGKFRACDEFARLQMAKPRA
jgi:hypothetical protein